MANQPTSSSTFLTTVSNWIQENDEVLVLIRYSSAAGNKDFEFHTSFETFDAKLSMLKPRDSVIVFRERQLPFRGTVDPDFVRNALELVPEGIEWLLLCSKIREYSYENCKYGYYPHKAGETHEELVESLHEFDGAQIALGNYPPWLEDNESVISAIVPEPDGSMVVGVY